MTAAEELFLRCVAAGLHEKPLDASEASAEVISEVLVLAEQHKLTGLVLDVLLSAHAQFEPESLQAARQKALTAAIRQQMQENELLDLLLAMEQEGLSPLVVKGAVLRNLYPQPLLRPSVDEDLYLPREQAAKAHALFCRLGLDPDDPNAAIETAYELSYHKPNSPTYIELHLALLDPDSPVFGPCNALFNGAFSRAVPVRLQDVTAKTLCPTDHLRFLLLHAYKHFLHSGFGIRLIADLCLLAEKEAEQIDHAALYEACRELRCERFCAALFRIGSDWLGFPADPVWNCETVDVEPLLRDILESGLHGALTLDRLHSSNLTLQTVAAHRQNRSSRSLLRTLFPKKSSMERKYPYLQKLPWLLPVAWAQRGFTYLRDARKSDTLHPSVSLQIGKERVELLKTYHIID